MDMSAAIGACLERLHTETLTRAVNACLPEITGVDARVNTFVTELLKNYQPVPDGPNPPGRDLVPLKRIYQDSHVSPVQRNQIFAVCIRIGFSGFSDPITNQARAEQTAILIPPAIRLSILQVIEMLSPKDRISQTLNALLVIFEGITSKKEQKEIVEAIKQMSPAERGDAIAKTASIVKGVAEGNGRGSLLEGVGLLPGHMRESVVALAARFVARLDHGCDRAYMLQVIAEIEPELREKAVSLAAPFMEGTTEKLELRAILKEIEGFLQEGHSVHIDLVLSLTAKISNSKMQAELRRNLLFMIEWIPLKDLNEAALRAFISVFQGMTDREEIAEIFKIIETCPKNDRATLVRLAARFIKEDTIPIDRILFLRSIKEIPSDWRVAVVEATVPFLEGIADPFNQVENLKIMERLALTESCADSIALTLSWMAGNTNGLERLAALGGIALLIQAGNKDSISLALMLTEDIVDPKQRTAVLQTMLSAIYLIPAEDRTQDVLEAIIYIFEDVTTEAEQKELLAKVREYAQDRRARYMLTVWDCLKKSEES